MHWDGGQWCTIAPNAPAWLRVWVQNNFRRTLLVPSREDNINSLGAAVQHNFRRMLLVPSREENIGSLGAAVQHNFTLAPLGGGGAKGPPVVFRK